ncbi:uncharacterized protein LOC109707341 isoform X2 [Ananas comosus]|uniref:Uncharacterized protein LOC109707341 isoform X2 n=1 Tax=Ananas comosus TaxID=4615 RepID=A0A6P5EKN6_ANACO|nr:uncharacterized protein LOC109707341 isoform X2 [Ananas comosus]
MCLMVVTVGCVYPILINYCMLCIPLSCMHSKDCVHVDKKFCAYDVSIDKKFCLDLIKQFFESVQLIGALLLLPVMVRASTLRTTVGSSASSSRATTTPSHVGSSSIGSDLPSSPPDTANSTRVRKKGRGVTKNVKWFKKFKPGEKSAVTIDNDLRRVVASDVVHFCWDQKILKFEIQIENIEGRG